MDELERLYSIAELCRHFNIEEIIIKPDGQVAMQFGPDLTIKQKNSDMDPSYENNTNNPLDELNPIRFKGRVTKNE